MEIEKKFLVPRDQLPADLEQYPYHEIEQAYLCTAPAIRIRKSDDEYYMTYKSRTKDPLVRTEYNLPLTEEAYLHLKPKADGIVICKRRYLIPEKDGLTIELDLFHAPYEELIFAEVEFESEEQALAYQAPEWFGEDVTADWRFTNSSLSKNGNEIYRLLHK